MSDDITRKSTDIPRTPQRSFAAEIAEIERHDLDVSPLVPITPVWGQLVNKRFIRVRSYKKLWEEHPEGYEKFISGLMTQFYGARTPFAYIVYSSPQQVRIYWGIEKNIPQIAVSSNVKYIAGAPLPAPEPTTDEDAVEFLRAALFGAYDKPTLDVLSNEDQRHLLNWVKSAPYWGAITGIPHMAEGTSKDNVELFDRFSGNLPNRAWGFIVLARPRDGGQIGAQIGDTCRRYEDVHAHIKTVFEKFKGSSSEEINAEAEYYDELLKVELDRLTIGLTEGMWETEIYFTASRRVMLLMGLGAIKGIFSGKNSKPEPMHTFPVLITGSDDNGQMAYTEPPSTMLTSPELSIYCIPLRWEQPGFRLVDPWSFDRYTRDHIIKEDPVVIGEVLYGDLHSNNFFTIDSSDFAKHGLICGITGSGKTNTCFSILQSLWKGGEGRPFLVIEPAKAEYRDLKKVPGFEALRVYTMGDDRFGPFRLNPFEFEVQSNLARMHVQTHIGYLRATFEASFVLYPPEPYVLDMCLHEIYQDKGWDLISNDNIRLSPDVFDALESGDPAAYEALSDIFPTLSDLYFKIDEVVDRLGYDERISMDVKAGLKTRIGSLRLGSKGRMLDCRRGVPYEQLLSHPTVVELERIGDDEEKAFLIGLLMVRLYEYHMCRSRRIRNKGLFHLTLIEEAHRLLKNVPEEMLMMQDSANTKGKAVETFANILAEIRSYGEGILIAEQIPSKLAPEALKNTNLKLLHRMVAEDERRAVGSTMNLKDDQMDIIMWMDVGRAIAYVEGEDHPLMLQIPPFKDKTLGDKVMDPEVAQFMKPVCIGPAYRPYRGCSQACMKRPPEMQLRDSTSIVDAGEPPCCPSLILDLARQISEQEEFRQTFSRYVLSMVVQPDQAIHSYPELSRALWRTAAAFPSAANLTDIEEHVLEEDTFVIMAERHFQQKGARYGWPYPATREIYDSFLKVLLKVAHTAWSAATDEELKKSWPDIEEDANVFAEIYKSLCERIEGPFAGCTNCQAKCLYRYEGTFLVRQRRFVEEIEDAWKLKDREHIWQALTQAMQDAAKRTLNTSNQQAINDLALCVATQRSPRDVSGESVQQRMVQKIAARFPDASKGTSENSDSDNN